MLPSGVEFEGRAVLEDDLAGPGGAQRLGGGDRLGDGVGGRNRTRLQRDDGGVVGRVEVGRQAEVERGPCPGARQRVGDVAGAGEVVGDDADPHGLLSCFVSRDHRTGRGEGQAARALDAPPSPSPLSARPEGEPAMTTRIGVIGCGFYAPNHLNAWAALGAEGAELAAVCDRDAGAAERTGRAFGVPFYTDAAAMLDAEGLDLVDIVTRHETHRPLAELTIGRGVATIVQKPFAPTFEDAVGHRRGGGGGGGVARGARELPLRDADAEHRADRRLGRDRHAELGADRLSHPLRRLPHPALLLRRAALRHRRRRHPCPRRRPLPARRGGADLLRDPAPQPEGAGGGHGNDAPPPRQRGDERRRVQLRGAAHPRRLSRNHGRDRGRPRLDRHPARLPGKGDEREPRLGGGYRRAAPAVDDPALARQPGRRLRRVPAFPRRPARRRAGRDQRRRQPPQLRPRRCRLPRGRDRRGG